MVFEDEDIESIDRVFSKLNEDIQIALFSATISNEVVKFINHYSFMISLGIFRITSGADLIQWNNIVENVYKDDIKEMLRKVSAILMDVTMYGTNEMSLKCNQFMEFWNKKFLSSEVCSMEDYKELDGALSVLLGEMKQELGMK